MCHISILLISYLTCLKIIKLYVLIQGWEDKQTEVLQSSFFRLNAGENISIIINFIALGPVVQRPISASLGLNFDAGFYIYFFQSLLEKIFPILFRISNDQIASKKIWTEFSFKLSDLK